MKRSPGTSDVAKRPGKLSTRSVFRCEFCGERFKAFNDNALRYICAECWDCFEDWGDQVVDDTERSVIDIPRSDAQYHGVPPWVT
jgi:protein-arginine kinase activator protein McsA